MKEHIVSVNDDDMDHEEVFIAYIREQTELIRCKDCRFYAHYDEGYGFCLNDTGLSKYNVCENEYCSEAEREEK